jgi:uncharacterized SAM-binding protein YcdF (DUF218 family)
MFIFKKTISAMIMPLPFGLIIAFIGLYLLWFTKKQKTGKILISSSIIFITLLSLNPVANFILSPLERKYCKYNNVSNNKIKYVVVLGGGHISDPNIPYSSQISSASLTRLIEAVTIYKKNKGSKLIVSGWSGRYDTISNAVIMANIAKLIGIPVSDIIIESRPKDTKDEAKIIKDIVLNDLFVLVTSASHMKRAAALFNHYNLNFIPAPTYFLVKKQKKTFLLPCASGLIKSRCAIHEYMGLIWAKFRKQI